RTYHLEVVQQPIITAAFETANLSRLALTPPVIVQLTVRDTSGNSVVPELELPFLVAHLSLFSSDGTPLDMGSSIGRDHTPPTLYGNIISSVEQLEDLQGNLGLFFLFPDVSIRWRGQYQLGIKLLRLYRSVVTILPMQIESDRLQTRPCRRHDHFAPRCGASRDAHPRIQCRRPSRI
ncbi:Velvet factor domain containing protein, partial [Amanita muscaria]